MVPLGPGTFKGAICFRARDNSASKKVPMRARFISSVMTWGIWSREAEYGSLYDEENKSV